MSFFLNKDGSAYRKWVNVVTSLLLPGSAHVLSGRMVAGVNWFLANLALSIVSTTLFVFVFQKVVVLIVAISLIRIGFRILIAVDGCRKPILRLNFAKWMGVAATIVFLPILSVVTGWQLLLRPLQVPTAGMQPTLMGEERARDGRILKKGDHVLAERFAYLFHKPQRGDVAIYKTMAIDADKRDRFRIPPDELYVKRIVGLPGERVLIQPQAIFINGQKLVEPKIFDTLRAQTNPIPDRLYAMMGSETEVQLGADEYYVLGDNIWNSLDSRYYGPIKGGYFGGKVFLIFWPPERRGFVQ
jgi:signal peptidase I